MIRYCKISSMSSDHSFYTVFPKLGKLPSTLSTKVKILRALTKLYFLRLLLITESDKNGGSFCIKNQIQKSNSSENRKIAVKKSKLRMSRPGLWFIFQFLLSWRLGSPMTSLTGTSNPSRLFCARYGRFEQPKKGELKFEI